MTVRKEFEPVANVQHARTEADFLRAINMSPENKYLKHHGAGVRNRPLTANLASVLHDTEKPNYEYFFIQNKEGVITACTTIQTNPKRIDVIQLIETSTRPEYKNQKLAKSLLLSVMRYVHEQDKALLRGTFSKNGRKYLARICSELHALVPDLKIIHGKDSHQDGVDFSKPYHIEFKANTAIEIVFD